jgi:hypothetical protein
MAQLAAVSLTAFVVLLALAVLPLPASAWNIPGNMLSATIAYQVLRQENPPTIEKVRAALEKHPWYAKQWHARLQDVPPADHGLVLFMQATRWADDVSCEGRVTPPGSVALHEPALQTRWAKR